MTAFTHTVTIDAAPEVVYRHLTEVAGLLRWIAVDAVADPVPGGELRWTHENGATMIGRYVELEPFRRIVFRYGWDGGLLGVPPESTTVEIDLLPEDGRTRLTLHHRGLPSLSGDDHAQGWRYFLGRLANTCGSHKSTPS